MSRGPGRVQRGILEALNGGPLPAPLLAVQVQASEDSTRRALRRLAGQGQVACLGYGPHGKQWGLPEDVEARWAFRQELWSTAREVHLAQMMGPRFARTFRRALTGML